jgi:protoporphyrinogen IX oxidase
MGISVGFHIIGIVMWIGGLLLLTRLLKLLPQPLPAGCENITKRLYFGFVVGGMVLTILSGIYQAWFSWEVLGKAGWFHAKLTMIVALIAITLFVGTLSMEQSRGHNIPVGRAAALHGFVGLLFIITVFLTLHGLGRI